MVLGSEGVFHSLDKKIILFEPPAGALVKGFDLMGCRGFFEPLFQQIGEQVVVPIPAPPIVQGHGEQIGSFQSLEYFLPVLLPGYGVAQRAAQTIQDAGTQQEFLGFLRQLGQDFID